MKKVLITVDGMELDFDSCKKMTKALAAIHNPETDLVAWYDKELDRQSPSVAHCDTEEFKGWEEYGRHHGGRWEMTVNNGKYVLIYT